MAHVSGYQCDAHGANCKDEVKNYVCELREVDVIDSSKDSYATLGESPIQACRFDSCKLGQWDAWNAVVHQLTRRRRRTGDAVEPTAEGASDAKE